MPVPQTLTSLPRCARSRKEWFAAWNAEDGDAVLSMMASGGRHYCPATGTQGVSGGDLVAFVGEGWEMTGADREYLVVCVRGGFRGVSPFYQVAV